jgi:hypothetical protein
VIETRTIPRAASYCARIASSFSSIVSRVVIGLSNLSSVCKYPGGPKYPGGAGPPAPAHSPLRPGSAAPRPPPRISGRAQALGVLLDHHLIGPLGQDHHPLQPRRAGVGAGQRVQLVRPASAATRTSRPSPLPRGRTPDPRPSRPAPSPRPRARLASSSTLEIGPDCRVNEAEYIGPRVIRRRRLGCRSSKSVVKALAMVRSFSPPTDCARRLLLHRRPAIGVVRQGLLAAVLDVHQIDHRQVHLPVSQTAQCIR